MARKSIFDYLIYAVSSLFVVSVIVQFNNTINYPGVKPRRFLKQLKNNSTEIQLKPSEKEKVSVYSSEPIIATTPSVTDPALIHNQVEIPAEVLENAAQPDPNIDLKQTLVSHSSLLQNAIIDRSINMTQFYTTLKIESLQAACPSVVRIGGDIGSDVCNPSKVQQNCSLLSFNSYNNTNFTSKFQEFFKSIGHECSLLGEEHNGMEDSLLNITTVDEIIEKSRIKEFDFLKIDVEDEETTSEILSIIQKYPICQILVSIDVEQPDIHSNLINSLSKASFRLFSINPHLKCEECCDYSFINEKCMKQFGMESPA